MLTYADAEREKTGQMPRGTGQEWGVFFKRIPLTTFFFQGPEAFLLQGPEILSSAELMESVGFGFQIKGKSDWEKLELIL